MKTCSCQTCPKKGQPQPFDAFNKNIATRDGYDYYCRHCKNAFARNARKALVESRRAAPKPSDEFEITVEEPPAAVEPPPPPLETAYKAHEERKQKRDLQAEHKALIHENTELKARIEQLVEMQKPPEVLVYRQPASLRADVVACWLASDWHVEGPVEKASVHGLNEYNLEVAASRARWFFTNGLSLTDMMARESDVKEIYIAALGDFFSGWIHEELIASNLLAPGEAANFWMGLFISGIDFLLRESKYHITLDLIPGNHGRMTKQMHFSNPTGTSLETFAYHALAGRYAGNPRVTMRVSEHAMVYRQFFENFTLRLIHGYEVKFGGGVGGITIPLNKAIAQWDVAKRASLTALGHFHQLFDGGNFIANGSLIGYNTFAQAIKAKYEEAKQAFFLVHARNGGEKSVTAPIWLDDAHSKRAA